MKKGVNCRAQMKMSFSMIFTIILIIVFIVFAFYGIKKFLDFQDEVQIRAFMKYLQEDVTSLQRGYDEFQEKNYVVPSKVDEICFVDRNQNFRLKGNRYNKAIELEGINIEKMLDGVDEYCIQNKDSNINLVLEMNPGENLVTIKRV